MTHVTVARVMAGLVALFVAAALGFGWFVNRRPGSAAGGSPASAIDLGGRALFDRHCSTCHEAGDLARQLRDAADSAALRREWLSLLEGHGSTSAAEDRAIVEYLAADGG